jgi:hypothetical protein
MDVDPLSNEFKVGHDSIKVDGKGLKIECCSTEIFFFFLSSKIHRPEIFFSIVGKKLNSTSSLDDEREGNALIIYSFNKYPS